MEKPAEDTLVFESFPVGPLGCNCTILGDPATGKGIIVDPGWDAPEILERAGKLGLQISCIVHTHAHIDHINGTLGVHEALGAGAELHEDDLFLWNGAEEQAGMLRMWGMPMEVHAPPDPQRLLVQGDVIGKGCCEMEVLHTPGHTPGSLSFFLDGAERPILFSGDTLFQLGVGRTDLEGGDHQELRKSIQNKLYTLPPDTVVIPGHGPTTTIEQERLHNPFVTA